jgi:hypothetical protein
MLCFLLAAGDGREGGEGGSPVDDADADADAEGRSTTNANES